jgi:phage/plasmid-associated DNA primase
MDTTLGQYAWAMDAAFITGSKVPDANAPTPALTSTVGRRWVYISENIENGALNQALFKKLTGEDKMIYRPLYREAEVYTPEFKMFMVCNNAPSFDGTSAAIIYSKSRPTATPGPECSASDPSE